MNPPRRPPIPRRPAPIRPPGPPRPGAGSSGSPVTAIVISVVAGLVVAGGIIGVSQMNQDAAQDGAVAVPAASPGSRPAPVDSVPNLTPVTTEPGTGNPIAGTPPPPASTPVTAPVQPAPGSFPAAVPQPVQPAPVMPTSTPASPPAAGPGGSAQDVIAQVKGSIVLILAEAADGLNTGTGFVVGPNQVATCHHVIDGCSKIYVLTQGGKRIAVQRVAAEDASTDLAVIDCGPGLPTPMQVGDSNMVRDGDEIAVTGFPVVGKFDELGFQPAVSTTRGTVSARRLRQVAGRQRVEVLQIDAAINPGNSGGPVYSVRDGSVVAIASSKLVEEQGIGFAVTVNTLRRLMNR